MARYGFWNDYSYTPLYAKQDKARRSRSRLTEAGEPLQPVAANGRDLAASWWGKAWNRNLERYSDYANRLPRGRSYLRGGMVLHLAIEPGQVRALVQGSRPAPYEVTIRVAALKPAAWTAARSACSGKLDSLQALLSGQFPEALKELFMVADGGLFPAPREIEFDCTCPDWASMCKHVAAVLYGVGARLDADPKLFFTLRQVSVDELVAKAVQGTSEALLDRAKQAADGALASADLGNIFGIEMDDGAATPADLPKAGGLAGPAASARPDGAATKRPARPERTSPRGTRRSASAPPADAAAAPERQPRRPAGGRPAPTPRRPAGPARSARAAGRAEAGAAPEAGKAAPAPMLAKLVKALRSRPSGLTVAALMRTTGLTDRQVRNAVARAVRQGLVSARRRGLYVLC